MSPPFFHYPFQSLKSFQLPRLQTAFLLTATAVFGCLPELKGDVVTQKSNAGFGQSWETPSLWDNNAVPTVGNTYFTKGGLVMRTPDGAGHAVFAGDSLTVVANSKLSVKVHTAGSVTVSNLILNGGTINNAGSNAAPADADQTLKGGLLITGVGSTITGGGVPNRSLIVDSLLSGSARLTIGDSASDYQNSVIFRNSANTFSGDWVVTNAILAFTYDIDPDHSLKSLQLNLNGRLSLTNDLVFTTVSVAGTALEEGIYTYSELSGLGWGSYFVEGSGTLSVTVIPEPSLGIVMLAGGGAFWAFGRRKSGASL